MDGINVYPPVGVSSGTGIAVEPQGRRHDASDLVRAGFRICERPEMPRTAHNASYRFRL
jgi:hypothetical protein